ncbi:MAG: immune inhibitor A domain-containing protein [Thermoleophilia bacterium]
MRQSVVKVVIACVLVLLCLAPAAAAMPAEAGGLTGKGIGVKIDHRPDPLTTKQDALRQAALQRDVNAKGKAYGKVAQMNGGMYVELAREGEDPVWTVLGEFSDLKHNTIAKPDRAVDNSTLWQPNFSRDYYMNILFSEGSGANSMRSYYIEQSSNRYAVYGDVTNWIGVPGAAAGYDDDLGGPAVWDFLEDSVDLWYAAQIAAGKSPAQIDAYLSGFDVWDRYDWDMDGDFDEPDGYIDHAQFVHAGEGEEAGGGVLGTEAIWSHSWFAWYNLIGLAGPSPEFLEGGIQIGNSSFWVNKYTIEPENGGVGVFTHEFAHDLGLPDLYDTTGLAENSTGFWTLMSSGSWLSNGTVDIGSRPGHLGAWEKFMLGWLNYDVAFAGRLSDHLLGPAETNTTMAQGLFVILPPKGVSTVLGVPYAGDYLYYSGSGNDVDNFMYKSFALPAGATLSAKVNYSIELDWDYAYLVVSTNGGVTWTPVATNRSTASDPYGQNFGNGITGDSGGAWVDLTADLSAYGGSTVLLGFRYWTDGAVVEPGLMIDNIAVTGFPLDGAESDAGWTFAPPDGFRISTGTESAFYYHFYVGEYRKYWGYDATLRNAYNFGWSTDPVLFNWVERFPYQDGLLVSYWDTSMPDNDVSGHPGQGQLLPIDAHPEVMMRGDGGVWRNRVQTFDSTFTLSPTEPITLHYKGLASLHASLPAVSTFDDRKQYYRPANPNGGVINPHTGTQIKVKSLPYRGSYMQVEVRPVR